MKNMAVNMNAANILGQGINQLGGLSTVGGGMSLPSCSCDHPKVTRSRVVLAIEGDHSTEVEEDASQVRGDIRVLRVRMNTIIQSEDLEV